MSLTNVLYCIPEDGDDTKEYNCFTVHKSTDDIRLKDVEELFPVAGEYHFRFQFHYRGAIVWLDLMNVSGKLPTIEGAIIIKALRKSWVGASKDS